MRPGGQPTAPSPGIRSAGSAWTPAVVRRQVVLEDLDPLPDGRAAIVVRRTVAGLGYRAHLWWVPVGPGRARALTAGAVRDGSPRVSADGRRVVFLRSWPGAPARPTAVMVLELAGGEPWMVVAPPRGVREAAWAPDGRRLALVAAAGPPRFLVGPARAGLAPRARRMTRIDWRVDGEGYRDHFDHCFVCAARPGARLRQLTRGDYGVRQVTWAPDGRRLAFVADRGPEPDLHPRPSVWAVPAGGGTPTELLALRGPVERPAFSPDGRWLAVVGVDEPEPFDDQLPQLFVGPSAGGGPALALAPALDRPVGAATESDLCGWMGEPRTGPLWRGAAEVVALVADAGRGAPWSFPVGPDGGAGGPPRRLVGGDVGAYALGLAGGRVLVLGTLGQRAGELMAVSEAPPARAPASPPPPRTVSTLGAAWQRRLPRPEVAELQVPGPGGPVAAFLVSPPGAGPGPLPTILDIHGGPLGAWGPAPPLEAFLLAGRGYRVLLPNPRGSAGYGRAWTGALLGAWGTVDAVDVLAAVDAVVARGLADARALGVMGLSYGGFLTQWLVATTDRFGAAVAENGVSNQVAAWGMCDTGPEYCRAGRLGDPLSPEGVAQLWAQSPLAHVAGVRTPLLLLQGGADLRCPPQDSEQLFVALRALRREVEYVVYPEESHLYQAVGRPDRRIDRMERVLAWFDRHLGRAAPAAS